MKKFLKITLRTVLAIIAVVALALVTSSIVNAVASNSEKSKMESYGQLVPVDGDKKMNVVISGQGEDTIVLLPGFGTSAPAYDFGPIIRELEPTHRVVAIEPLGYGLSDGTDRERTTANIVDEVHQAVNYLGLEKFVLMGHSIAGLYGITYANTYPEQVSAFVGIDSSVPKQGGMDVAFPTGIMGAAKSMGLARIAVALEGDTLKDLDYSDSVREQMRYLALKNSLSPTYLDEMSRIGSNFADAAAQDLTFPSQIPVLLFVVSDLPEERKWIPLHEEQASKVDLGEVVVLDGDHYLHHTQAPAIGEKTLSFLAGIKGPAPIK